jgi:hypothetical protein
MAQDDHQFDDARETRAEDQYHPQSKMNEFVRMPIGPIDQVLHEQKRNTIVVCYGQKDCGYTNVELVHT